MQHRGGGIDHQRAVGDDTRIMPTLAHSILRDKHMIREDFAEAQGGLIGGFCFGLLGFYDFDFEIQHVFGNPFLYLTQAAPRRSASTFRSTSLALGPVKICTSISLMVSVPRFFMTSI